MERWSTNAKLSQTVLTCCDIESRLIGASFPLIRIRLYIRSMKRTDKTNVDPFSLVFIEQFSFIFHSIFQYMSRKSMKIRYG